MPLRIGVIAPPWFEIPPHGYGGIEWLCHWLVGGLVDRGHDVTLVAAGARHTAASFVQTYADPPSARLGEPLPELLHAATADSALGDLVLDVVHDNSFAGPLTAAGRSAPTVVTAHGPVEGELGDYYRALGERVAMVAISDAQRRNAPGIEWVATVHNAIPVDDYRFRADKDDVALFLGRMSPDKGAHIAIEAAREAGIHLIVAGKCSEPPERHYFDSEIRPRLGSDVSWIGHADADTKKDLLALARCLVFPIQWEEPFGLVMIEAMASGTPVVALRRGSVPEVVEHEVTGFICDHPRGLAEYIKRADVIDPAACRERARAHFDVDRMVEAYESVFKDVIERSSGTS